MSNNLAEPVADLAYIGRALQPVATGMAAARRDAGPAAIVAREDPGIARLAAAIAGKDATMDAMLEQLPAIVDQHQGTAD